MMTPGPWTINPAYPWQVLDGNGILVCSCENNESAEGIVNIIGAAKEVLNHASGKSIDGTERPITDEDGCLKNWMEVLEMVRAALAKAGAL